MAAAEATHSAATSTRTRMLSDVISRLADFSRRLRHSRQTCAPTDYFFA
jgi:hypothetical protein